MEISGVYTSNNNLEIQNKQNSFQDLIDCSDALYIISQPSLHYQQIKEALNRGKHVLCETPIAL